MKRRLARECALKVLFMNEMGANETEEAFEYITEMEPLPETEKEFVKMLVEGTLERRAELDSLISQHLVNWRLDRVAATVRNILRLALYEIKYMADVPPLVSINEAIELAKAYHDEEAGRFVNGILDRLLKETIEGKK